MIIKFNFFPPAHAGMYYAILLFLYRLIKKRIH